MLVDALNLSANLFGLLGFFANNPFQVGELVFFAR